MQNSSITRYQPGERFCQATTFGDLIFLAGQTAPEAGPDVRKQSEAICAKIDALLAEAGSDKRHVLIATNYLVDVADIGAMNEAWDAWCPADAKPARATVGSPLVNPDFLVEVVVIACKRPQG